MGKFRLKPSMTVTFLELGDATSRNLEFSHRTDVSVSYGEETITETNLLEIRRRHSDRIFVHTFPKTQEAKTGADWEWHIIGRSRTARMRVQAKRLQSNHVLKVKHKVVSSGKQQRQLLIDGANADGMKPLYCIYCSEPQRTLWTQGAASGSYQAFQSGCLLADASDIPLTTKKLDEIEDKCIPWHYLFKRSMFLHRRDEFIDAEVGSFPEFGILTRRNCSDHAGWQGAGSDGRHGVECAHHRRPQRGDGTGFRPGRGPRDHG